MTRIIASKYRVVPMKQIIISRIEICAAVLSCHLQKKIQRELDWHFESLYHLVDSTIVRHQI